MRSLYLENAKNTAPFAMGVLVENVNGQPIIKGYDDAGQPFTHRLMPGADVDYSHMNEGRGLQVYFAELDQAGDMNIKISPGQIREHAIQDPDGHTRIVLDLTGWVDGDKKPIDRLSPLARVVASNARALLSTNESVRAIVGSAFDAKKGDEANYFETFDVAPKNFAPKGMFEARVDTASLDSVVDRYIDKHKTTVAATSAKEFGIRVFRLNHKPGDATNPEKPIGDLSEVHGATLSDIERAAKSGVKHGVHFNLNAEIQHSGNPFSSKPK
jgi:hypothetical protein